MDQVVLNFEPRSKEEIGKQGVKRVRSAGFIPAIVYGAGKKPQAIKLDRKELHKIDIHHENVVVNLLSEGRKQIALIKEVQRHPVNNEVLHIDFEYISLREKIRLKVPVVAKGESPGVKAGGILEHLLWEVEIECFPANVPEQIDVDVSNLNIGDLIYVKDLRAPEGVKIVEEPEQIVLSIEPPKEEEIEVKEELGEKEKEEPEVIRKGKEEKEEEGE
ncbi:MAG: 50S ribosomal protein L25 [Candidatus Omnitrophota bacterium]|nr:MAG: 50S ribosomal protein L25 [Candidatus Omnitrophota bacterium]